MYRVITFIILFGFFLVIGSCIQEKDMYDPEIIFTAPVAGYVVDLPDTLDIKVEISDAQIIRSVLLTLVNENKIPVIAATWYYPNNPDFFLEASLSLVDKALASGPYNLLVTVSDGINQKNKYRQIIIHEIPLHLKAYIVVTGQSNFKSTIIKLNPAFETDTQFVFPEGYWLSAVQSLWENFFFVSGEPSKLTAFNPESFETEWEMAAEPPRPLFTSIFPDKELVFSTANGDAGIISKNGNITLRTASAENKTIQCLAVDDKYIYAAHVSLSGNIHELTVYYRVSGNIREQKLLAGEIRSLIPVRDKLLVFNQLPTGTGILEYDPEDFILTEMSFLPDESLKSVVKISEGQLFLVTEQRVISYDLANNRFTDFTDQPYNFCRYDPLYDIVFLVRDNMVYGFDRVTGDLMAEKSLPEEVLDFQILYNK